MCIAIFLTKQVDINHYKGCPEVADSICGSIIVACTCKLQEPHSNHWSKQAHFIPALVSMFGSYFLAILQILLSPF